jgi:hypothetical protein
VCSPGEVCGLDGQCSTCAPYCPGPCGDNGCGDTCGTCTPPQVCSFNQCISPTLGQPCPNGPDDCGDNEACLTVEFDGGESMTWCSETCTDDSQCAGLGGCCPENEEGDRYCVFAFACGCFADCLDRECGSDGCSGSCGTCGAGESCSAGGHCVPCFPSCGDRECGNNGCDGSCGDCAYNELCNRQGKCGCIPDCSYRECGDDGCGGSCGLCPIGYECDRGECI